MNVFSTGDTWASAIAGRNDATVDAFIAWCEETAPDVPIPVGFNHEPNFQGTGTGNTGQDYGRLYRWFRSRMDAYAAAHGGVGVYQWKNLSLGPILMGVDYQASAKATDGPIRVAWPAAAQVAATSSNGTFTSAGHMLSNGRRSQLTAPPAGFNTTTLYYVVNASSNTFQLSTTLGGSPITTAGTGSGITVTNNDVWDWCAADPYIGAGPKNGKPAVVAPSYWTPPMQDTLAWVEDPAHTYPLAVTEWGIWHLDPNAGTRIAQWYNRCLDGTHDIWYMGYFNSDGGGKEIVQWILDNVSNANLLDNYVALMKDPRSVHFWDLTRPDGSRYAKPTGATF
jgi:hypothetical protein